MAENQGNAEASRGSEFSEKVTRGLDEAAGEGIARGAEHHDNNVGSGGGRGPDQMKSGVD